MCDLQNYEAFVSKFAARLADQQKEEVKGRMVLDAYRSVAKMFNIYTKTCFLSEIDFNSFTQEDALSFLISVLSYTCMEDADFDDMNNNSENELHGCLQIEEFLYCLKKPERLPVDYF